MPDAGRRGPVGIGIIGAGNISSEYVENLAAFPDTTVLAIGDLVPALARAKATEHGIAAAGDPATVLDHPDVEIVVNLTIPAAHADVAEQALAAGRHVWNEKPLALDRSSARRLVDLAADAGLRLGCAPDTFLGDGLQAARRAIDDGTIGRPMTALAILQSPGPDAWHPNPAFLFQEGAGPLFDLGPYYLTALVQAFGAVARAGALASTARQTRAIGAGPRKGETFEVTADLRRRPARVRGRPVGPDDLLVRLGAPADPARDLRERGHADPPRPQRVRRRGPGAAPRRGQGQGRGRHPPTVEPRDGRARHGPGDPRGPAAPRGRRASLPCARRHGVDPRIDRRRWRFVEVASRVARAPLLPDDWDPGGATLAP